MSEIQLNVVLVRTLYESNVGAAARAMANMGANQLILVDKQCEIGLKAHQGAASAQPHLEQRVESKSLQSLLDENPGALWIALCGKDGKGRLAEPLNDLVPKIELRLEKSTSVQKIFLVFGPEDWGLNNDDLVSMQYIAKLPTFGPNSSLNLAQAVLLSLFIFRQSKLHFQIHNPVGNHPQLQQSSENIEEFPEEALKEWLIELGMDVSSPRTNALTTLRRFFQRQWPTEKELGILKIVLQQSVRKLKEYNVLRDEKGLPLAKSLKKKT